MSAEEAPRYYRLIVLAESKVTLKRVEEQWSILSYYSDFLLSNFYLLILLNRAASAVTTRNKDGHGRL